MEDAIRKELNELCREILSNSTQGTDELLKKTRLLEEKLVLLRYMKYREEQMAEPEAQYTAEDRYDRELEETLEAAETSRQEAAQRASASPITPQASTGGEDYSAVSKQTGLTEEKQPETAPATPRVEPKPVEKAPEPASVMSEQVQEKPAARTTQSEERKPTEAPVEKEKLKEDQPPREAPQAPQREREKPLEKQKSLHQRYTGAQIKLGLNDRIAFSKHLFEGNQEDLNRVISQLNTFDSYPEAEDFIVQMVKPDYDWSEKEEYEERLRELVKARFGE